MGVWELTAIVLVKSLWWIIPTLGSIIAMVITERED